MSYTSITLEGNLISAEIIEQIPIGTVPGQQPTDFGLDRGRRITDEIAAVWAEARDHWRGFQSRLNEADDSLTSLTRAGWVIPLLRSLSYTEVTYMPAAATVDNHSYRISHRVGTSEEAPPIDILAYDRKLDDREGAGRAGISPHARMQEYLNITEHLWGIITNGRRLRLMRDSSRTVRPTYIEFDLEAIMSGEKFSEFALLYRLLHRTRLPNSSEDGTHCLLEQYHQLSIEQGGRVREGLRESVKTALVTLGNGLISYPSNIELQSAITSGTLPPIDYYRQLLRLVYRLLFLMVAEERKLIGVADGGSTLYRDYYSISRLRTLAQTPGANRGRYTDLWQGLLTTFRALEDDAGAAKLGLTALNGDLFGRDAIPNLATTRLPNSTLLRSIKALSIYEDPDSHVVRRVNYSALDVEELGSVYESLLDFRPQIVAIQGDLSFDLVTGTERKTTGSYYTRPELVHELIVSALEPVLANRLQAAGPTAEARKAAILNIAVCDPACGSGAFLLAAARRLARELATIETGEAQPASEHFRAALREVITHCIYGVDANPLAVDLCKLGLWIESFNADMPLSFLDHHIRCGNSLIGTTRALVDAGIPDEAYNPVTGDSKTVASALKKRNKKEREFHAASHGGYAQKLPFDEPAANPLTTLASAYRTLRDTPDNTVSAAHNKAAQFARLQLDSHDLRTLYNLWTAAFFMPLTEGSDNTIPTTRDVSQFAQHPRAAYGPMVGRANDLGVKLKFFHWELEFPDIFELKGGFDVVLGNPPWELLQVEELQFFEGRDTAIAKADNIGRQTLIGLLPEANPALYQEFKLAQQEQEAFNRYIKASNRFQLTAVGRLNTYALFAEHSRTISGSQGRVGIIVPTGIATDDTYKLFFGDLTKEHDLISLFDFENRDGLFPDVHRSYKFCLLTIGATNLPTRFSFFAHNTAQSSDPKRVFTLMPDDIRLINPNTLTCPIFRTNTDAELIKKIHRRVPILSHEQSEVFPWAVLIRQGLFNLTADRSLFTDRVNPDALPLYEGRMAFIYDHRFATFDATKKEYMDVLSKDPSFTATTEKYVPEHHVEQRLRGKKWDRKWFFGVRRVTRNTDVRTLIGTFLPYQGVTYGLYLFFSPEPTRLYVCLASVLNSLVCDFICRTALSQPSLTSGVIKQLPVLPPEAFSPDDIAYISERVLELVYTAWDIRPFAVDLWAEMDEAARARVRTRWQENHGTPPPTGHDDVPPPFRWDEERRAHIRAELDARIARLYGLTRDELRYILDPADVYGPDFPGETFRVLKEKEIKRYGEYRTRRLVLEAWDNLEQDLSEREPPRTWVTVAPASQSSASPARDDNLLKSEGIAEPSVVVAGERPTTGRIEPQTKNPMPGLSKPTMPIPPNPRPTGAKSLAAPHVRGQAQPTLPGLPQPGKSTSADTPPVLFKVGDRVKHTHFGVGEIVALSPPGKDQTVTVVFGNVGTKRLLAGAGKLEHVSD